MSVRASFSRWLLLVKRALWVEIFNLKVQLNPPPENAAIQVFEDNVLQRMKRVFNSSFIALMCESASHPPKCWTAWD